MGDTLVITMAEDVWLYRPEITLSMDAETELESLWPQVESAGGSWLTAELPVQKWQFFCWLTDHKDVLLHGSGDPDIKQFEPRAPNDRSPDEFSKQTAVFAASDGIWPIFYAILDRSAPGLNFLNAALEFETSPDRRTCMHYFFSVTEELLERGPWRDGVIYILPRHNFVQQPPYELTGRRVVEPHWASPEAVSPLAKVRVSPMDFPLLHSVRGHDNDAVARRSAEDPNGFPWIE